MGGGRAERPALAHCFRLPDTANHRASRSVGSRGTRRERRPGTEGGAGGAGARSSRSRLCVGVHARVRAPRFRGGLARALTKRHGRPGRHARARVVRAQAGRCRRALSHARASIQPTFAGGRRAVAVLRAAPAMLRLARGAKFGARRRSLVLVWAMFRDFGQALVPLAPSRRPACRAGGRLPSPAAMACARFAPDAASNFSLFQAGIAYIYIPGVTAPARARSVHVLPVPGVLGAAAGLHPLGLPALGAGRRRGDPPLLLSRHARNPADPGEHPRRRSAPSPPPSP